MFYNGETLTVWSSFWSTQILATLIWAHCALLGGGGWEWQQWLPRAGCHWLDCRMGGGGADMLRPHPGCCQRYIFDSTFLCISIPCIMFMCIYSLVFYVYCAYFTPLCEMQQINWCRKWVIIKEAVCSQVSLGSSRIVHASRIWLGCNIFRILPFFQWQGKLTAQINVCILCAYFADSEKLRGVLWRKYWYARHAPGVIWFRRKGRSI